MDSYILKVENLSKKYCKSLKRSLLYGLKDIGKELTGRSLETDVLREDEFWALKDISFELKRGESLGVIGRNGAGKTTLLKLINGLIKPTMGKITINGKVGALIALGTGFNPVLTGRENIKIAGAVLGFSSREMDEKMDEIIEFSDIGDFIDAPVRSYSSGMLVRLGFAVAIQLQPDLLLVDEVLAVGDLRFAVKCLKKITEYQNNGGTLILVSHNLDNVRFHCHKCVWLHRNKIEKIGETFDVCKAYELFDSKISLGSGSVESFDKDVEVIKINGKRILNCGDEFFFEICLETKRIIRHAIINFGIADIKGEFIIREFSNNNEFCPDLEKGKIKLKIVFESLPLSPDIYSVGFVIFEGKIDNHIVVCSNCFKFEVIDRNNKSFGKLHLDSKWELTRYAS